MAKKRAKDLDPKSRASKVRGGNIGDDQKNVNRSVGQISKTVTNAVTELPKKGVRANPL
jgi:hypothetical protein